MVPKRVNFLDRCTGIFILAQGATDTSIMELSDDSLARVLAFIDELEAVRPPDRARVLAQRQAPRPDWKKMDLPAIDRAYRRFWLAQTGTARRAFIDRYGSNFTNVISNELSLILDYCRHVLDDQREHGTWPRPDACRLLSHYLSRANRFDLARRVELGFQEQVIRSDRGARPPIADQELRS